MEGSMEGKAIEEACIWTTATSTDLFIVVDPIPQKITDFRVPAHISHINNKLSKKTSSDPSSDTLSGTDERWSSLWKMVTILLLCGIMLCIVSGIMLFQEVLPTQTFIFVLAAAFVFYAIAIFLSTIIVVKGRKEAPLNMDIILSQLDRDRL